MTNKLDKAMHKVDKILYMSHSLTALLEIYFYAEAATL